MAKGKLEVVAYANDEAIAAFTIALESAERSAAGASPGVVAMLASTDGAHMPGTARPLDELERLAGRVLREVDAFVAQRDQRPAGAHRHGTGTAGIHKAPQPPDLRAEQFMHARHVDELPTPVRALLRGMGVSGSGRSAQGAALASYLLFEQGYTRELMALGESDVVARRSEVLDFFGWPAA